MQMLGQPFAAGRTAEVYHWGDDQILKLYRDWCPVNWVEHEARIARIVNQAGIPAPRVGEILEIGERKGILYERLDGIDMLSTLQQNFFKLPFYGKTLAQLHLNMHACVSENLPSQRNGLIYAIEHAQSLPGDLRQQVLQKLEALPDDNRLCHGDFHPGNVLLTQRGPIVIDWMTAVKGHPAADVARTRLLLTVGDPPQRGFLRLLILLGRSVYNRSYLQTYRQAAPEIVALSDAYMIVLAAARLHEDIAAENTKLIKMLQQGLA